MRRGRRAVGRGSGMPGRGSHPGGGRSLLRVPFGTCCVDAGAVAAAAHDGPAVVAVLPSLASAEKAERAGAVVERVHPLRSDATCWVGVALDGTRCVRAVAIGGSGDCYVALGVGGMGSRQSGHSSAPGSSIRPRPVLEHQRQSRGAGFGGRLVPPSDFIPPLRCAAGPRAGRWTARAHAWRRAPRARP